MTDWSPLIRELDAWGEAGQEATFWWRDDDAARVTPALVRLLMISSDADIPIAIAAIPDEANDQLRHRLSQFEGACVLQHGYKHQNHAPEGVKKSEFGPHRDRTVMLEDIIAGGRKMAGFQAALPVFVPPWNRIDENILPELPRSGLTGVSTFGPRPTKFPFPGLIQANTHVDIVNWRNNAGFAGSGPTIKTVVNHLQNRRNGTVDPAEPTGLLTHHLAHDAKCWKFIETFLRRTRDHGTVRWVKGQEVFRN